ncbi:MAG: hypothetical protein EBW37_06045 [Rhodobacteraceae bacterium]|nr:hypothetical protein [Paracoccaceae bacterium]
MSDLSNTDRRLKSRPRSRFEYVLFFSLIFVLAIPFSTVGWMIEHQELFCQRQIRTLERYPGTLATEALWRHDKFRRKYHGGQ